MDWICGKISISLLSTYLVQNVDLVMCELYVLCQMCSSNDTVRLQSAGESGDPIQDPRFCLYVNDNEVK